MPDDALRIARALLAAAVLRWLTDRLPTPPTPEEALMSNNAALVARWYALPVGPVGSRLLVGAWPNSPRVISPVLLSWYARLVELEHEGPRETWPRWWEMPGGAEEPSARERLG